jgi:type 1 fimbria pilin
MKNSVLAAALAVGLFAATTSAMAESKKHKFEPTPNTDITFSGPMVASFSCGPHNTRPMPAFSWTFGVVIDPKGKIVGRHDYMMRP